MFLINLQDFFEKLKPDKKWDLFYLLIQASIKPSTTEDISGIHIDSAVDNIFSNLSPTLDILSCINLLRYIFLENHQIILESITSSNCESYIKSLNDLTANFNTPTHFRQSIAWVFHEFYKKEREETGNVTLEGFEKGLLIVYEQKSQLILNRIKELEISRAAELEKEENEAKNINTRNLDEILGENDLITLSWKYKFCLIPGKGLIIELDDSYPKNKETPVFPFSIEEFCDFLDYLSGTMLWSYHNWLRTEFYDFRAFTEDIRKYLSQTWETNTIKDIQTLRDINDVILSGIRSHIRNNKIYEKFVQIYPTGTALCIEVLLKKFSLDLRMQFNDPILLKNDLKRFLGFTIELLEKYNINAACTIPLRDGLQGKMGEGGQIMHVAISRHDLEIVLLEIDNILRSWNTALLDDLIKKHYPSLAHKWILSIYKELYERMCKFYS